MRWVNPYAKGVWKNDSLILFWNRRIHDLRLSKEEVKVWKIFRDDITETIEMAEVNKPEDVDDMIEVVEYLCNE